MSLYRIWICVVFLYVVLCICTRLYVYTGVICCVLCLNACNRVDNMIFVYMLVLTMQMPMYIAFGASAHSRDGYPVGLGLAPLWVSWYLPRVRLDPGLHTAFGHHIVYR